MMQGFSWKRKNLKLACFWIHMTTCIGVPLKKVENFLMLYTSIIVFLHLVQSCKFLNPKVTATFRGEDLAGHMRHMSKMSHSVSFGVRATKLSQKLAPKYQALCHLLKTRTDFDMHSSKSLIDLAKGILKKHLHLLQWDNYINYTCSYLYLV